ncbi:MAG: hypothetical protein H0X26_02110 [Alphaproteobacteria bacterium]|nr:hypothetical protein [Alphaproteobacteria bacterium]
MDRFIYVTPFLIGLTASYAVAAPLTQQQVQQVNVGSKVGMIHIDWNFVTDINGLVSLIDKNPLPKNEIDALADKLSINYAKALSIITPQGDFIEHELNSLCEGNTCDRQYVVKLKANSLKTAIVQYKRDILLLPSLENVKAMVNALEKDPKAEKSNLTALKTAVDNAKPKIESEFNNLFKIYDELLNLLRN